MPQQGRKRVFHARRDLPNIHFDSGFFLNDRLSLSKSLSLSGNLCFHPIQSCVWIIEDGVLCFHRGNMVHFIPEFRLEKVVQNVRLSHCSVRLQEASHSVMLVVSFCATSKCKNLFSLMQTCEHRFCCSVIQW